MSKQIEDAKLYIAEVLADIHDHPAPNDICGLIYSTLQTHLGAIRFLLLGEPEKAQGLLANYDVVRRLQPIAGEVNPE